MKKVLLFLVAALSFGVAFAGDDDITAPIITNVFTTSVSQSSSSLRAVRVGKNATTGKAAVIFNQEGYAPVVLSQTDGVLTLNGTALTTATIAGTDITVSNDLSVGRDAAITRNATVGGTLGVTGATTLAALSGTSGALSTTLSVAGNSYLGAANYKSTNTASSGAWAFPATVSIGGVLTQTGAINAASTLSVGGNVYLAPATAYTSTFTAASGNLGLAGDVITGDDAIVGDDLNVTGLATVSETLSVTGNSYFAPATAYTSTFTASSGNWDMAGALSVAGAISGPTSVTATKLVASGAGSVGLYSRSKAQILALTPAAAGQAYYCSDCTAVTVCVSTGTGVGAFTKVDDRSAACD